MAPSDEGAVSEHCAAPRPSCARLKLRGHCEAVRRSETLPHEVKGNAQAGEGSAKLTEGEISPPFFHLAPTPQICYNTLIPIPILQEV